VTSFVEETAGTVASLLERDLELELLGKALAGARGCRGSLVIVEGPAGVGKSALLTAAGLLAVEAGCDVLTARGAELEREFAFGVARQLFERHVHQLTPGERGAVIDGAAGLAGSVLALSTRAQMPLVDPAFAITHGLYWLCANLAERRSLMLCIDDAHWADRESLRFLSYLAPRLDGVPVLVVVATRSGEDRDARVVLDASLELSNVRRLTLAELSEAASVRLIEGSMRGGVEREFARQCHEATGGNPFLLRRLLASIADDQIAPIAANANRIVPLGAQALARITATRLGRLSEEARAVARSLAILGSSAPARAVAEVADLEQADLVDALDGLFAAALIGPGLPLRFEHPLIERAIHENIPPHERSRLHRRAAEVLIGLNATPERIAAQLLHCPANDDEVVVEALLAAARAAMAKGAPGAARLYLERALAEPPPRERRSIVLHRLALAQLGDGSDPLPAFEEAFATCEDPVCRAEIVADLAGAIWQVGEPGGTTYERCLPLVEKAISDLGDRRGIEVDRLESLFLGASVARLQTKPLFDQRIARLRSDAIEDSVSGRLLLVHVMVAALAAGEPPRRIRKLAERVLAAGSFLAEVGTESQLFYLPIDCLMACDELAMARRWCDTALDHARSRGSVFGITTALMYRSQCAYRAGDLRDAEADATASAISDPTRLNTIPVATLVPPLIERGALDEAGARINASEITRLDPADWFGAKVARLARGLYRLARGDLQAAVSDVLDCGAFADAWGPGAVRLLDWRPAAVTALISLGERDQARTIAADGVELANRLKQARLRGTAMRALALAQGGDQGIELLREAASVLSGSPARLEAARTLVEYGSALRRSGRRRDARPALSEGLDLAYRCGATALASRAREELIAAGARPRRERISGVDSLTASERRVAQLAADGMTNREIAQTLFITMKTVATHLTHCYQKLDITSRDELRDKLTRVGD
jgi:DNA-binding CsgD family transcriptional regulator